MRKFKFEILVRDKIVEGIKISGNKPKYHVLSKHEFVKELKKKLVEESLELPLADKIQLKKELADVQEVFDSLLEAVGATKKEIKNLQRERNKKAGSFKKRYYVKHVEANDDSEWIAYYLKSPNKYPEIK